MNSLILLKASLSEWLAAISEEVTPAGLPTSVVRVQPEDTFYATLSCYRLNVARKQVAMSAYAGQAPVVLKSKLSVSGSLQCLSGSVKMLCPSVLRISQSSGITTYVCASDEDIEQAKLEHNARQLQIGNTSLARLRKHIITKLHLATISRDIDHSDSGDYLCNQPEWWQLEGDIRIEWRACRYGVLPEEFALADLPLGVVHGLLKVVMLPEGERWDFWQSIKDDLASGEAGTTG